MYRLLQHRLSFDGARQEGLRTQEIGNEAQILGKRGKGLELVAQFNFWKKAHRIICAVARAAALTAAHRTRRV
jgi:hypothetical protein